MHWTGPKNAAAVAASIRQEISRMLIIYNALVFFGLGGSCGLYTARDIIEERENAYIIKREMLM